MVFSIVSRSINENGCNLFDPPSIVVSTLAFALLPVRTF
jgi:hypothetical protein